MTFQNPHQTFAADLHLFPVRTGADDLGSVLLANTLLRAAATVGMQPVPQDWFDAIEAQEHLPLSQLIAPDTQLGCAQLCAAFPADPALVEDSYRRAFHLELFAHFAAYDAFFAAHHLDEQTRTSLQLASQHAHLVATIEALAPNAT